jgi:hypothetical protein
MRERRLNIINANDTYRREIKALKLRTGYDPARDEEEVYKLVRRLDRLALRAAQIPAKTAADLSTKALMALWMSDARNLEDKTASADEESKVAWSIVRDIMQVGRDSSVLAAA